MSYYSVIHFVFKGLATPFLFAIICFFSTRLYKLHPHPLPFFLGLIYRVRSFLTCYSLFIRVESSRYEQDQNVKMNVLLKFKLI